MYQTITEDNSNIVFAVVKSKKNNKDKTILKRNDAVALAVKEEWSYDTVELIEWSYDEMSNKMTFNCVTEDGDKEIRVVDLSLTTLYK